MNIHVVINVNSTDNYVFHVQLFFSINYNIVKKTEDVLKLLGMNENQLLHCVSCSYRFITIFHTNVTHEVEWLKVVVREL